jgi:arylsulfatase A-like enzyme
MKKAFSICSLMFCVVLTAYAGHHFEKNLPDKPNILLIMTDQQTATSLSCTGNAYVRTPAMDKLAMSGVRFEQSYVTQPLCLPFRSSLQTSRYPHEIGTVNNGRDIDGDFPLLGNLVAEAGYECAYYGKWHVGTTPDHAGYAIYDKAGKDHQKTDAAVRYLAGRREKPFFMTVSYHNPHNICQLARADADGSDLPDGAIDPAPVQLDALPPLPDNFAIPDHEPSVLREIQERSPYHYPTAEWDELTWRQYLWGYYRLVEKVDAEVGRVLTALNEGGHADNTVIIFTSDHGEGVAMHHWNQKQILYDQATRVPLIVSWEGHSKSTVCDELVSNALDIPVTILDLIGADAPPSMRGLSLVPILEGVQHTPRKYVVAETMFARGSRNLGATGRMLRAEKYKYCIYDSGENREQLFDMQKDPGETVNLAADPEYAEMLNEYRGMMADWARETDDPGFPYQN